MAAIALGLTPHQVDVALSRNAVFEVGLRTETAPYPDGVGAELRFYVRGGLVPIVTWVATVTGSDMTWAEDEVAVDALITAKASLVRLYYLDTDGDPVLWAKGGVRVY